MTTPLAEAIRVLKTGFTGVPVGSKSSTTARHLRVTRAGGSRDRSVDHMTLLVECWAPTSVQAELDAIAVDDLLRRAPNISDVVTGWDDNRIVDFPDPDPAVQLHRFQVLGTLHCLTF